MDPFQPHDPNSLGPNGLPLNPGNREPQERSDPVGTFQNAAGAGADATESANEIADGGILDGIGNLVSSAVDVAGNALSGTADVVSSVASGTVDALGSVASGAGNLASSAAEGIGSTLEGAGSASDGCASCSVAILLLFAAAGTAAAAALIP